MDDLSTFKSEQFVVNIDGGKAAMLKRLRMEAVGRVKKKPPEGQWVDFIRPISFDRLR